MLESVRTCGMLLLADNQALLETSQERVQLLLTDPPWGAGTQNKGTPYEFEDPPEERDRLIALVSGYAGRCAATCLIACDDRWMPHWHIALRAQGFTTATIVCESQLGNPGKKKWPIKHYYWIIGTTKESYFTPAYLPLEERRARIGSGEVKQVAGVIRTTMSNTDPERVAGWQAQKPLWLMEAFIRAYTQPGDTVVDPYLGTGVTGKAALRLEREFIGYEKNPESYALALNRMGN